MHPTTANHFSTSKANSLKKRTLEIFFVYGSLNPPAWAKLTNFFPVRAAYTYLLRLHRFGLLNRTRDSLRSTFLQPVGPWPGAPKLALNPKWS
jgi:hypothetical protein